MAARARTTHDDTSTSTSASSSGYAALSAPFDVTYTDTRGGVELTYVTGEQVCSRLNQVLGVGGWSFRVLSHDVNPEADEAWALGEIVAEIEGKTVTRQQFGSQKIKRSRTSGTPLDIGFDLKGAATDAMKKCASLLGVGLYLSKKEPPVQGAGGPANGLGPEAAGGESLTCAECGHELTETRFRDGTVWPPAQLAGYGRRKHNRVLCMEHYRAANEARRRSERSLEEVPF